MNANRNVFLTRRTAELFRARNEKFGLRFVSEVKEERTARGGVVYVVMSWK